MRGGVSYEFINKKEIYRKKKKLGAEQTKREHRKIKIKSTAGSCYKLRELSATKLSVTYLV